MSEFISRRNFCVSAGLTGIIASGASSRAADRSDIQNRAVGCLAPEYTVVLRNDQDRRGFDGPAIVRMPDGPLLAVVPSREDGKWVCVVVQSRDDGGAWEIISKLTYNSAVPWVHDGRLYLFAHPQGKKFREDDLLLLCSQDVGRTWSEPVTLAKGHFWNCQTGMVVRDGRLYWAVDDLSAGMHDRGPRVVVGDLSGDVMDPRAWRISNFIPFPGLPEALLNSSIQNSYPSVRMLEPNVIEVNGRLRLLMAVKPPMQATTNLCAVFDVTDDGHDVRIAFTQYHPMPGGQVKFCVQWDDASQLFWATVNLAVDGQDQYEFRDPHELRGGKPYPGAIGGNDRRFLMLFYGLDGLNWFPAGCIAHGTRLSQSFMYPSHIFDGDDLLVIARSSINGHNRHDADTYTFHRVRDFRSLALSLRPDM